MLLSTRFNISVSIWLSDDSLLFTLKKFSLNLIYCWWLSLGEAESGRLWDFPTCNLQIHNCAVILHEPQAVSSWSCVLWFRIYYFLPYLLFVIHFDNWTRNPYGILIFCLTVSLILFSISKKSIKLRLLLGEKVDSTGKFFVKDILLTSS